MSQKPKKPSPFARLRAELAQAQAETKRVGDLLSAEGSRTRSLTNLLTEARGQLDVMRRDLESSQSALNARTSATLEYFMVISHDSTNRDAERIKQLQAAVAGRLPDSPRGIYAP